MKIYFKKKLKSSKNDKWKITILKILENDMYQNEGKYGRWGYIFGFEHFQRTFRLLPIRIAHYQFLQQMYICCWIALVVGHFSIRSIILSISIHEIRWSGEVIVNNSLKFYYFIFGKLGNKGTAVENLVQRLVHFFWNVVRFSD